MLTKRLVFTLVLSTLVLAAWLPAEADIIHRKNGTQIKDVEVRSEMIDVTTYVLPGGMKVVQKMDSKKIARVEYESKPLDWDAAESARMQNFFNDALAKYDRCSRMNPNDYPWIRQYALFGIAETYRAWADAGDTVKYKNAIAAYQGLLQGIPKTIHRFGCLIGIGNCYLAMGKFGEAETFFTQVIKANHAPSYTIRAKIGSAMILEKREKFREARSKFREIYNEARSLAVSDPSAKNIPNRALVREGACLVGLRKFDEALGFFQDLIKKAETDAVLAGAYNGLGDCYRAKRRIEDAMWAYLKVAIVWEHVTSEAPKAFYYASLSMRDMATKMGEDQARTWIRRSKNLKGELRAKFRGSPYAQKN